MKINYKEAYEKYHLLTGVPLDDVKSLFKGVLLRLVLDFAEGDTTIIPGLGEVKISYLGDEIIKEGKRAKLSVTITLDDNLIRNVGQAQDEEELDIEREIKNKIRNSLDGILNG